MWRLSVKRAYGGEAINGYDKETVQGICTGFDAAF